ncbi:MAG: TIGR04255 family protein [candidate division Zixibacteria bacterium]|nr:TIGR04255 family protein [candidate division Zixibacteria bacterium]
MAIEEIFANPTVQQVIFQIKFPNLFFMENKIGEFQVKIMEKFPQSALLFRRQLVFANVGSGIRIENPPEDNNKELQLKIWQFMSPDNVELNVTTDSLDIGSKHHKTYNLGTGDKFRDIIEYVVGRFLDVTQIPNIMRIGLRYIDICPIPGKNNDAFLSYYNSAFPLNRFPIENATEMHYMTVVRRDAYSLRYIESFPAEPGKESLTLDFDGFAENIPSSQYLEHTDRLHDLISDEYEASIKEALRKLMRRPKGANDGQ